MHYIFRVVILAVVGLNNIYDKGEICYAEIVLWVRYFPPYFLSSDLTFFLLFVQRLVLTILTGEYLASLESVNVFIVVSLTIISATQI